VRVVGPILVALFAAAAATAAPAHAATPTCGKLLAPGSGVYFGAAPDFVSDPRRLEGDTVTTAAMDRFETTAGRKTVLSEFSQHWFLGLDFPRDKVMTVWRHGQVPYVRMEAHAGSPWGQGNPPEQYPGDYSLQNIIDGKFDTRLRAWAAAARDTNIPLLLEFGIEENNDWGPWAGDWNGAGMTNGYGNPAFPDGPERFRDAYRHLVTLFREQGATNVTWFFHVDTWWGPREPWDTYGNYYPGDDYVDWLGLSLYGWNDQFGNPTSFEDKLQNAHSPGYPGSYADITSLGAKPLALTELGVPEGPLKPRWITDAFAALPRYPLIKAIFWWDSSDVNTRIDSSPASAQAFRDAVKPPAFDTKPQFSGNCLPAAPTSVKLAGRRLSWRPVPNAVSYEIWRNGRRVAATTSTTYAGPRGTYRVRAVNPLGLGPFAAAR
jgi:hypothetical protein